MNTQVNAPVKEQSKESKESKEIVQHRRSSRIYKIITNNVFNLHDKLVILFKNISNETNIKQRINYTMELFNIMLKKLPLFYSVSTDVAYCHLLQILFSKGLHIQSQIRGFIQKGDKLKTIDKQYIRVFTRMQRNIMKYYRDKLNAITQKVWLNDDVVHVIYSYI